MSEAPNAFGPYRPEAGRVRLSRDGEPLAPPERQAAILLLLVVKAGTIVAKEALLEASGSHFLLGLVRLARGDEAAAVQEFEQELALDDAAHIDTREACAYTWCAVGAVRLRQGDRAAASAAFERALVSVPDYALALAGRAFTTGTGPSQESEGITLAARLEHLRGQGASVETATVEAVREALAGRHASAAALVQTAFEAAPAGNSCWILPVEPLLQVAAHPDEWAPVRALVCSRAA